MEFTRYAIAYLDILGFKKFVEDAEDNNKPEKLMALKKLFEEVIPREISIDGKNASYPDEMKLRCLSFSDSIVVSAPFQDNSSYPALIAVSIKAIQISHSLLDMELLVRGGIAVGNIYQTDSNILGTGYQKAVQMEKVACNPQIILDESAESELDNLILKQKMPTYSMFAKNELGKKILNSIHPEKSYLPDERYSVDYYFKKYRETILESLNKLNCQENSKAKEKWIWFARLFNANVNYFSCFEEDVETLPIAEALLTVSINYLNPTETNSEWMEPFKALGMTIQINH